MKETDVLIAHNKDVYNIKVEGRANLEYAPPLRTLAKTIEGEKFEKISIDLEKCTAMDSTFMGVLAMLSLRAKKIGSDIEIVNATDSNIALLRGLGIDKLFNLVKRDTSEVQEKQVWEKTETGADKLMTAETILDAHDTLMDVDPGNIPKFEKVVDLTRKEIDKMDK